MVGGLRRRDLIAAAIIAVLTGGFFALPGFDVLRGLSIDLLTGLRYRAFGTLHPPETSPAVVVALDEETYRTPPFEGTPNVTWTRELGRVVTALIESEAKVIGFDVIFPTSIEQSSIPYGEETLGARVRGFDRDYLRALALAARAGKLVLGQVQHQDHPIVPSPGQRTAVGQQRNIRALNVYNDDDEIVRRVPLTFDVDGAAVNSISVELAARALGTSLESTADGHMSLGGYTIPGLVPNTLTLNFDGGIDDVPTFALADLHACLEKDDKEFLRRNFAGKVVLIGTVLDIEDRKHTSKRFATAPEGPRGPRCVLPPHTEKNNFTRDSIPGVYIHATAVNNLLRRHAVREVERPTAAAINLAMSIVGAGAALLLAPLWASLAFLALVVALTGAATMAFLEAIALPLLNAVLAGALALVATIGYRFVVADRDKRLLRKSFALYLAPAVIEKLMASNAPPALGGESRSITVFFSDVAGFSSFAEKMTAAELVALMNEYLSAMTDIIEEHGGFVDKYIGDAIVAVFGAPLDDPQHAVNATRAALRCQERLADLNLTATAFKGFTLGQRIGLNSGEALVGNIGSRRRFNYTVMGDTVNLASRLEGANKYFATAIMASEMTVTATGKTFFWRELDAIRVKGRAQPVKIYEALSESGQETAEQKDRAAFYAAGLACWRDRDFAGALQHFSAVAADDPPSALFFDRAQKLAYKPPGPEWEPVNTLEGK